MESHRDLKENRCFWVYLFIYFYFYFLLILFFLMLRKTCLAWVQFSPKKTKVKKAAFLLFMDLKTPTMKNYHQNNRNGPDQKAGI